MFFILIRIWNQDVSGIGPSLLLFQCDLEYHGTRHEPKRQKMPLCLVFKAQKAIGAQMNVESSGLYIQ